MKTILLFRHGNTFLEAETPRMVGAHEDLPLVPAGVAQAQEAAAALAGLRVTRVSAGPLLRTRQFAETLGLGAVRIDAALRELDYGAWSGLSDAEITASYGEDALRAWRDRGVFHPAFKDDAERARARINAVIAAHPCGLHVVVSSNGLLRLLHPAGKAIATGKACVWKNGVIAGWNLSAKDARALT